MADGFIPFSTQLDFIWNELQGKEKAGFGKFLSSGASTPEDFATLWDETYERSGFDEETGERMGDKKARAYAGSVYNSLQGPRANPNLISPNAKTAFEFFRGKGLSPEMSSGITGRLMAESYEGLNPDARNRLGGGMGAYGIAQWRGSRMQDLANFAGVDINDITKLPNSFEGGGLLSPDAQSAAAMSFGNNEASKMINQFPDPMATDQDPAKRQGFGGLLDYLKKADPNTGLNRYDKFAASLDSLIMPEMRAGDSIRAGGMQRVAAGNKNKTIEALKKYAANDPRAKVILDAVQAGALGPSEGIKEYLSITAAGNKNPIRATQKYLNGTSYVITDTGRRVYDPSGKEVFGDAAAKVLEEANTYENENRALGEGLSANAKFQQEAAKDMFEKAETIRGSISNIDQAIASIDDGAPRGLLPNMLPDITAQSGALSSALSRMGLDVVGSVTFGALSKSELDIAMATAYPPNASGPELRKFLEERKVALSKLLNYTDEAAAFMSNPNNTRAQWLEIVKEREAQREASGANPFMGLSLEQLRAAFESTTQWPQKLMLRVILQYLTQTKGQMYLVTLFPV